MGTGTLGSEGSTLEGVRGRGAVTCGHGRGGRRAPGSRQRTAQARATDPVPHAAAGSAAAPAPLSCCAPGRWRRRALTAAPHVCLLGVVFGVYEDDLGRHVHGRAQPRVGGAAEVVLGVACGRAGRAMGFVCVGGQGRGWGWGLGRWAQGADTGASKWGGGSMAWCGAAAVPEMAPRRLQHRPHNPDTPTSRHISSNTETHTAGAHVDPGCAAHQSRIF